jgi:acid-sensing ion channel, other
VIGSGFHAGLSVDLKIPKAEINKKRSCKRGIQGFRMSLHTPIELPQMTKQFYNIPLKKSTTIIVHPQMIHPSKDVKPYDPVSRQCYCNDERKLKFFRTYSKSSCGLECLAEQVLDSCGCVKFSMPHDNQTKVCDILKLECVYEAEVNYTTRDLEKKLLSKQLKRDLKRGKTTKKDPRFEKLKNMESCNCLPSCTSLYYDAEISQTDFLVEDDDDP